MSITLTKLAVTGASCECCSNPATVSVRRDEQVRYYCGNHVFRPVEVFVRGCRR